MVCSKKRIPPKLKNAEWVEGGLSDILGLDAVNVGGAETHVHTMQYIWNDSAFLWHKS